MLFILDDQDSILEGLATVEDHFCEICFVKNFQNSLFGTSAIWGGQKQITEDSDDWEALFCSLEHSLYHIH